MTKVEIISIAIYIVIYAVVFVIQKAQFNQQKSIMEKYEKMFSIINIDEIEKYVNVKEKSLKLQFENREKEITVIEEQISLILKRSEEKLREIGDFKKEKEDTKLMITEIKELIEKRKHIDDLLLELNEHEFNEIYNTTFEKLKTIIDEKLILTLEKELFEIKKKYLLQKNDLLRPIVEIA